MTATNLQLQNRKREKPSETLQEPILSEGLLITKNIVSDITTHKMIHLMFSNPVSHLFITFVTQDSSWYVELCKARIVLGFVFVSIVMNGQGRYTRPNTRRKNKRAGLVISIATKSGNFLILGSHQSLYK